MRTPLSNQIYLEHCDAERDDNIIILFYPKDGDFEISITEAGVTTFVILKRDAISNMAKKIDDFIKQTT